MSEKVQQFSSKLDQELSDVISEVPKAYETYDDWENLYNSLTKDGGAIQKVFGTYDVDDEAFSRETTNPYSPKDFAFLAIKFESVYYRIRLSVEAQLGQFDSLDELTPEQTKIKQLLEPLLIIIDRDIGRLDAVGDRVFDDFLDSEEVSVQQRETLENDRESLEVAPRVARFRQEILRLETTQQILWDQVPQEHREALESDLIVTEKMIQDAYTHLRHTPEKVYLIEDLIGSTELIISLKRDVEFLQEKIELLNNPDTAQYFAYRLPDHRLHQWMREGVVRYHAEKHDLDTYNRTYPGRFVDHVQFLRGVGFQSGTFIDIGPGLADYQNQLKQVAPGYPAITSREIAEAFPESQVIALDLIESAVALAEKREQDERVGAALLAQENVRIMAGDGLKSLKEQLEAFEKDYFGRETPESYVGEDPIVIRACNSIDIYCDWDTQVKPALDRMLADFKDQRVVLFFYDKILIKPAGIDFWIPYGSISQRAFNHNQQTTNHVAEGTPHYTQTHKLDLAQARSFLGIPEVLF